MSLNMALKAYENHSVEAEVSLNQNTCSSVSATPSQTQRGRFDFGMPKNGSVEFEDSII